MNNQLDQRASMMGSMPLQSNLIASSSQPSLLSSSPTLFNNTTIDSVRRGLPPLNNTTRISRIPPLDRTKLSALTARQTTQTFTTPRNLMETRTSTPTLAKPLESISIDGNNSHTFFPTSLNHDREVNQQYPYQPTQSTDALLSTLSMSSLPSTNFQDDPSIQNTEVDTQQPRSNPYAPDMEDTTIKQPANSIQSTDTIVPQELPAAKMLDMSTVIGTVGPLSGYLPCFNELGFTDLPFILDQSTEFWQQMIAAVEQKMKDTRRCQMPQSHKTLIMHKLNQEKINREIAQLENNINDNSNNHTEQILDQDKKKVRSSVLATSSSSSSTTNTTRMTPHAATTNVLLLEGCSAIGRHWCCLFGIGAIILCIAGGFTALSQHLSSNATMSSQSHGAANGNEDNGSEGLRFLTILCAMGFAMGSILVCLAFCSWCRQSEHSCTNTVCCEDISYACHQCGCTCMDNCGERCCVADSYCISLCNRPAGPSCMDRLRDCGGSTKQCFSCANCRCDCDCSLRNCRDNNGVDGCCNCVWPQCSRPDCSSCSLQNCLIDNGCDVCCSPDMFTDCSHNCSSCDCLSAHNCCSFDCCEGLDCDGCRGACSTCYKIMCCKFKIQLA